MQIDIFCKVVDNYGDAGFSWRLTRRLTELLTQEYFTTSQKTSANTIRLFCGDLPLIQRLAGPATIKRLKEDGLELFDWSFASEVHALRSLPDVVLETFSCEIPVPYLKQISSGMLINIEYLTAEHWIEDIHQLATLPSIEGQRKRHFFCPGFNLKTGGLLGKTKDSFLQLEIKEHLDVLFLPSREKSTKISIFNYGRSNLIRFIEKLKEQEQLIDAFICFGKPQEAIKKWLNKPFDQAIDLGNLRLIPIPFISQEEYDELLQRCDLNWVRGEDSFVRAQWAAKPFIWDIYPQSDAAHEKKLAAFLDIYLPKNNIFLSNLFKNIMENQEVDVAWEYISTMQEHALHWQHYLHAQELHGDLGLRLLQFIKSTLKTG